MPGTTTAIVDLVWRYGYSAITERMDTLNTLVVSWFLFGLLLLLIGKFLYGKYLCDTTTDDDEKISDQNDDGTTHDKSSDGTDNVVIKSKIVPAYLPPRLIPPVCNGGDPDAVRWLNEVLIWFYEGSEGGVLVKEAWNDNLNELTVNTALETGVLIEVLEVLPATPPPLLTNLVVDCQPNDDMTLTCDVTTDIYLRVQSTRTQKDLTMESEYACAVKPLRGRVNGEIKTHDRRCYLSLVGWPEVKLELEGTRNNCSGLDEKQLQEVIKEVLVNSIRCVSVNLDFSAISSFPLFRRARDTPDRVIPIGYDALVREVQTHPPATPYKVPPQPNPLPSRTFTITKSPNFQGPKKTSSEAGFPTSISSHNHTSLQSTNSQVSDTFLKPYNNRQRSESGSTDEEIIEEAGESFTSLFIPTIDRLSTSNPNSGRASPSLTPSEESLVQRTIKRNEASDSSLDSENMPPLTSPERGRSRPEFSKAVPVAKRRSASRSPPRRIARNDGPLVVPNNVEYDQISDPMQSTWKSLPQRSDDDEEDEGEVLRRMLRNAQSFKSAKFNLDRNSQDTEPSGYVGLNGKRLLVKVVRASNIGAKMIVVGSYVVVEMDEPSRKHTTKTVYEDTCPYWEEQFVFDLSENTLEILFEVYHKPDDQFLGLGIVGIEELVATPSQRQVITLQSRPYEEDKVSGTLTCEFLFLDKTSSPDITFKSSTVQSENGTTITTTTYSKGAQNTRYNEPDDSVAEIALRDLERRQAKTPQKSTLIIHASKKVPVRKPEGNEDSYDRSSPYIENDRTPSPGRREFQQDSIDKWRCSEDRNSIGFQTEERGRKRSKKRDFFGTLKKRLSRSKNRSHSMEPDWSDSNQIVNMDPLVGRSASVERARLERKAPQQPAPEESKKEHHPKKYSRSSYLQLLREKGFLSVPGLKFRSNKHKPDSSSGTSSLSGTSGISSGSTKTYINEASLMIVEALENGKIRHYLIPISLQRKNKWRKRGTKLHVYNGHCFVAKHMSRSTTCETCMKTIGRSIGKQAYECRDCALRCHKPCHVQTTMPCPNSSIDAMDLIHISDNRTPPPMS